GATEDHCGLRLGAGPRSYPAGLTPLAGLFSPNPKRRAGLAGLNLLKPRERFSVEEGPLGIALGLGEISPARIASPAWGLGEISPATPDPDYPPARPTSRIRQALQYLAVY